MKIHAASLLSLVGSASAFSPAGEASARARPLLMSDPSEGSTVSAPRAKVKTTTGAGFGVGDSPAMGGPDKLPKRRAPRKSEALPFMNAPLALDGTLAGDAGFDPMGWADSFDNLANYREAEVKHGRLAMLAAAGWPLSELWDVGLAKTFGMEPVLDVHGRVPSVLNGGMGKISTTYWIGCLALAGAIDVYGSYFNPKRRNQDYVPGDLGFDPLGFYPKDDKGRKNLQLSEIKHGRLAMVAITAFAFQEYFSETAVIDQTPIFFKPIWEVLFAQSHGPSLPEVAPYVMPEVSAPAFEAARSAVVEAPAAVPQFAAPAVEAVTSVAPAAPEVAAPAVTAMEAATAVPPPVVEPLAAAPVEAVAAPPAVPSAAADELAAARTRIAELEELATAKTRIVELESKLSQIEALTR